MNKFRKLLVLLPLSSFNIAFSIMLLLIAVVAGIAPTVNKFGLYQPTIIIFACASALAGATMLISSLPLRRRIPNWVYIIGVAVLFTLIACTQVLLAKSLASTGYAWDSGRILTETAAQFESGKTSEPLQEYLNDNPNNVLLALILMTTYKLGANIADWSPLTSAIALNVIVLFVSQVCLFVAAYMLYGRRIAALSLLYGFALIGLTFYVHVPYTDTLSISLPIIIFLLGLLFVKFNTVWARLPLALSIGILTIFGYLLKPTVIFMTLALIIAATAWMLSKRHTTFKKTFILLLYPIAMLLCAGFAFAAFPKIVDATNLLNQPYSQIISQSKPPHHFIAMGMRSTIVGYSVNYGGYYPFLADTSNALQTYEGKKSFAINAIQSQLATYTMPEYAKFLALKLRWITSDATFFAFGEGDNRSVRFIYNDRLSMKIREFVYPGEIMYLRTGNILQIIWVSLLLLIGCQAYLLAMHRAARHNPFTTALRLSLAMLLIFLLVFEGRSRYIFLYLPIFILLGMYTLSWFKPPATDESQQT